MSESKVARRYARALAELCEASNDHAKVAEGLDGFAAIYEGSDELRDVLRNPTLDNEQKGKIVSAVLDKMSLDTKTRNFLLVLLDRGRIESVTDVAKAFQEIVDVASKRIRATVTSSVPMSAADLDRVQTALGRLTGHTVNLESHVDAELIGGARVQIGNLVLDSSIRSHLDKLRDQLVH